MTFQRGTRLITDISGLRIEDVMPAEMPAPPTSAEAEYSADGRAGRGRRKARGRRRTGIRLEWAASWKGRTKTATVRMQVPYSGRQRAGAVE